MRWLLRLITHALAAAVGFAAGIYTLPLLVAPPAPTTEQLAQANAGAMYRTQFVRDLPGSDFLHWGEGEVTITPTTVTLQGRLAPGPDYRLYLSPVYVDTKADFEREKPRMVQVGEIRTFDNFVVKLPPGVDPSAYDSVIVWCERFRAFITAARYR